MPNGLNSRRWRRAAWLMVLVTLPRLCSAALEGTLALEAFRDSPKSVESLAVTFVQGVHTNLSSTPAMSPWTNAQDFAGAFPRLNPAQLAWTSNTNAVPWSRLVAATSSQDNHLVMLATRETNRWLVVDLNDRQQTDFNTSAAPDRFLIFTLFEISPLLTSQLVLQINRTNWFWGRIDDGVALYVRSTNSSATNWNLPTNSVASSNGWWHFSFIPTNIATNETIEFSFVENFKPPVLTLTNVSAGNVFLLAGGGMLRALQTNALAQAPSSVRIFVPPVISAPLPLWGLNPPSPAVSWKTLSLNSVLPAVAMAFATQYCGASSVPLGIIVVAAGASQPVHWTASSLEGVGEGGTVVANNTNFWISLIPGDTNGYQTSSLFNGMIAPLAPRWKGGPPLAPGLAGLMWLHGDWSARQHLDGPAYVVEVNNLLEAWHDRLQPPKDKVRVVQLPMDGDQPVQPSSSAWHQWQQAPLAGARFPLVSLAAVPTATRFDLIGQWLARSWANQSIVSRQPVAIRSGDQIVLHFTNGFPSVPAESPAQFALFSTNVPWLQIATNVESNLNARPATLTLSFSNKPMSNATVFFPVKVAAGDALPAFRIEVK